MASSHMIYCFAVCYYEYRKKISCNKLSQLYLLLNIFFLSHLTHGSVGPFPKTWILLLIFVSPL